MGIWSGPEALWTFKLCSNLHTPLQSTVIPSILQSDLVATSGMGADDGLVKTDANWFSNISAFDLLSTWRVPETVNGDTQILSCLFDFIYFQKGFVLFSFSPVLIVLLM